MTTIFTLVNQKGGVGKTTSTVSLGHKLAQSGDKVLMVDVDPQGQISTALGLAQGNNVFNLLVTGQPPARWVQPTGRENLWIIPGDRSTGTAQIVMNAENRPVSAIYDIIKALFKDFDYIIFDTAPSVGGLQERVIWASGLVVIPTVTEFMSSDGLSQVLTMIDGLTKQGWKGKVAGILPTFFDEQTRESQGTLAELKSTFGNGVLPPIHRATILRECAAEGVTIFEKDPKSRAAQEYTAVIEHLRRIR